MKIVRQLIENVIQACSPEKGQRCREYLAFFSEEVALYLEDLPCGLRGIFFLQRMAPGLRSRLARRNSIFEASSASALSLFDESVDRYLALFRTAVLNISGANPYISIFIDRYFLEGIVDLSLLIERTYSDFFKVSFSKDVPIFKNPYRYEDLLEDVFAPALQKEMERLFFSNSEPVLLFTGPVLASKP